VLIDLAEWVADVVEELGYIGLALMVTAENLFPPIPSEIVLPLAGFLVGQERMTFVFAVVAATAGSLTGALVLYGLGAIVGEKRLRRWISKVPLLDEADADRAQDWFERHGNKAVLFGRLIPLIRSVISLPAGIERMPIGRFVLYTAIGSATWNTLLIGAGVLLGEQWDVIRPWLSRYQTVVLVAIGLLVVAFVVIRWRQSRSDDGG
jgi:membrane protein DedA with SNARE-associated domain